MSTFKKGMMLSLGLGLSMAFGNAGAYIGGAYPDPITGLPHFLDPVKQPNLWHCEYWDTATNSGYIFTVPADQRCPETYRGLPLIRAVFW